MSETRALSPDVKSLFNTVKLQAKQYNDAFNTLTENTKNFYKLIDKTNNLLDELHLEPKKISGEINASVKTAIEQLHNEKDALIEKYEFVSKLTTIIDEQNRRVNDISNFKDEMESLRQNLLNKKKQIEILFDETKSNAENTIKRIIEDGREQIRTEIENSAKQVENNIVIRQRQIEGKLIALDDKYFNLTDQLKADLKRLYGELQMLENLTEDIKKKSVNQKSVSKDDLDELKQDFKFKLKDIENKINTINNTYRPAAANQNSNLASNNSQSGFYESEEAKSSNPEIEKVLKPLREKIHELDERLTDTEKKIGLSVTMAWISILSVIILIIVSVIFLS